METEHGPGASLDVVAKKKSLSLLGSSSMQWLVSKRHTELAMF